MLVLKRENQYIGEQIIIKPDKPKEKTSIYIITNNINEAKNFRFATLIIGRKNILEGITNIFGIGFNFVKTNPLKTIKDKGEK
jgi:hypothetical protein